MKKSNQYDESFSHTLRKLFRATKIEFTIITREGSIEVIASYGDSIIIANSNHLFVLINYETAEIGLTLSPTTLRTTIDSMNVKLINTSIKLIILKGKLNIPYVKTFTSRSQTKF